MDLYQVHGIPILTILNPQNGLQKDGAERAKEKWHTPPPPSRHCLAIRHFSGEGVGEYVLSPPPRQEFYMPPAFTHPPPPLERHFQGWGLGVHKILTP